MQQELIEMLEEIIPYVEVWKKDDQDVIDKAEALVAKAKNNAPAQYKDSTPQLSVGESFESWFESYNPANKGDKQRARDAYAAGMGDPLVAAPAPPATDAGAVGDAFEQAFNLIFETYSKPADNFNDDEQWAIWQHGKVTKAFTLLQQVRAARAKGASDEVDCTCA